MERYKVQIFDSENPQELRKEVNAFCENKEIVEKIIKVDFQVVKESNGNLSFFAFVSYIENTPTWTV